ncbi:hypothetical protein [Methyloglobulus sp.]|uniref:hypothetical protein n=1 Tax=Methyloglobulus sp. TaxID=2518622 RepID=UPI003988F444
MKLTSITLALSIPPAALAKGEMQAEINKKVGHLTKDLGLNTEQQAKVKAIFEEQEQKKKSLHEEVHAQMQQVLTPKQLSTMEEKHKRHDAERTHKKEKDCDK